tara:strand:- start:274 stop:492 length:219 start_codon:yes stop_codon:yes gene_type:complete
MAVRLVAAGEIDRVDMAELTPVVVGVEAHTITQTTKVVTADPVLSWCPIKTCSPLIPAMVLSTFKAMWQVPA